MRLLLCYCFLFLNLTTITAQISRAKIELSPEQNLFLLARLGIDVSHGEYAAGRHFTSEFSAQELAKIQAAGFSSTILVKDVQAWLIEENSKPISAETAKRNTSCLTTAGSSYQTPQNFTLGSMAGYYTYAELLDILDDMAAQYPDIISVKQSIGSITSHEGRPIYWVKISDHHGVDEAEPEVFYNAVHHAREPAGLTQLVHYMWYLLENYATDPEVKYLVDNTEMYFIPCINPDGYVYNQTTNPNGGGFWRKNRREHGGGDFGVDLNRNYGFQWGFDDTGSSPNPTSNTYRGASAFSEPETQAVRDFCNQHNFLITLNYHTYGNLLIYPWGYSDSPTPDAATFNNAASVMINENGYTAGTGTETVGYIVNGDSDDWMYGEQGTKNKIISMTPEVGTSFWPPISQIEGMCKATMWQNLTVARLPHVYGIATDLSNQLWSNTSGSLDFRLDRHGLTDGSLTVSLTGLSANIQSTGTPKVFNLAANTSIEDAIDYTLSPTVQDGEMLVFELAVSNGSMTWKETLTKTYGNFTPIFSNNATDLNNWTVSNSWNTTNSTFVSSPNAITDSPNGNYNNNRTNTITTTNEIDLTNQTSAILRYNAKWDIENNWDYVQVQLSINGSVYTPLCGKFTNASIGSFQPSDEPVYDGLQSDWIVEEIDLMPYINGVSNPAVKIRFTLHTDGATVADGFYFDDVQILTAQAPLAVHLIDFSTKTIGNREVELSSQWEISSLAKIEIERSSNGLNFASIHTIQPEEKQQLLKYIDKKPLSKQNYYRLLFTEKNGKKTYSPIRFVQLDGRFKIYLNERRDHLNIELNNVENESIEVVIYRADGTLLVEKILDIVAGKGRIVLPENRLIEQELLVVQIHTKEEVYVEKVLR